MTYREAVRDFKAHLLPRIPKNDKPSQRQEWNDWTDALCKGGLITQRQYDTWGSPVK